MTFEVEGQATPLTMTVLDGGRIAIRTRPDADPVVIHAENSVAGRFFILNWLKRQKVEHE